MTDSSAPPAIGGRVLDVGALIDIADRRSVYGGALITTALSTGVVLALPATAVAAARTRLTDAGRARLHIMADLWVVVVDPLTWEVAEDVGDLLATTDGTEDLAAAHAARLGLRRGWRVLTDRPAVIRTIAADVAVEELP